MATKYDEEYWVLKMVGAVKANLNTRIAAINAEKNDGLSLSSVNDAAYYYMTFGNALPNYDPCVIFAVNVAPVDTVAGRSSYRAELMCQLTVSSAIVGNAEDLFKILSRYRRALLETIASVFSNSNGAKVIPLTGSAFATKSGGLYYTVGVGVEVHFA